MIKIPRNSHLKQVATQYAISDKCKYLPNLSSANNHSEGCPAQDDSILHGVPASKSAGHIV